jgi:hypothetical protein
VVHLAVVDELKSGEVVVNLPEQIGEGQQDDENDAESRAACEDDAPLRREHESDEQRDKKDDHRRFVLDAQAAGEAEEDPPARCGRCVWRAAQEHQDGEDGSHPEDRLEGVHGEEAVEAEKLRRQQDAEHGERLRDAAATERPADDAGEKDGGCAGECGEHADAGEGFAEEGDGGACLQRDDGTVIDIAPVEMLSAEDVVHLVAEVAPPDVGFPEIGAEVNGKFQQREQAGEEECLAEGTAISSRGRCQRGVVGRTGGGCVHSLRCGASGQTP